MTIQYENLTIRQAEAADAKQLAAWWNDGAVMAHAGFPNGLGITEEEVKKGLGGGCMVIEEEGRLIGECSYLRNRLSESWGRQKDFEYADWMAVPKRLFQNYSRYQPEK